MAHAQGLLTRPSLNLIQDWALRYHLDMSRRIFLEDKEAELERQLLHINPEGWERAYGQGYVEEPELPVADPRNLDAWVANLNKKQSMSGADVSPGTPFWSAAGEETS